MEYEYLIIDSNNLGYRVFKDVTDRKLIKISDKYIYRPFVQNFIYTISFLEKTYNPKEVILLFDNHTSREELRKSFQIPVGFSRREVGGQEYKANRTNETSEFYASLDFIKYYYSINSPKYHTVKITRLEADDLVAPLLKLIGEDKKVLFVTNDNDWAKYINDHRDYLPNLYEAPRTISEFKKIYKYLPTEEKVVLYKILFGDRSDNIKPVFPDFDDDLKIHIVTWFPDTFGFCLNNPHSDKLDPYMKIIKERESQIKTAYQVLSSIPVSIEHLKANYTTGRKAERLLESINSILFENTNSIKERPQIFSFGGLKVPRSIPKP